MSDKKRKRYNFDSSQTVYTRTAVGSSLYLGIVLIFLYPEKTQKISSIKQIKQNLGIILEIKISVVTRKRKKGGTFIEG